jgi:H+/Cl- antiporter ClcA
MDPKERSAGIAQEALLNKLLRRIRRNEEQLFLVLTLVIGVVVGLTIVAFVVLTERVGLRLYPVGAQPWRRLFMPVVGSVLTGYLLYRYFPNARGSGIPQTKTALFSEHSSVIANFHTSIQTTPWMSLYIEWARVICRNSLLSVDATFVS